MLALKVWSDFACFTRPESKVERMSYDVMTPSAARGVLEAVFWKPQFSWQIREIWVLRPIQRHSILRNEVNTIASGRTAQKWSTSGGGYYAEEDRSQRHSLILRDVAYIIHADIVLKAGVPDPLSKYRAMFERRVEKGQAHHQPYLGNREFTAFFSPPSPADKPIEYSTDLGRMLFDLDFTPQAKGPMKFRHHQQVNGETQTAVVDGRATPRFFSARLEKGILRIPPELYRGVG